MGGAVRGAGAAHCDTSGSLTDRCRQGSWQQVDCSYFSFTAAGGGQRKKTTSAVTNLWAFKVQRCRLIKGNEEVVCVRLCVCGCAVFLCWGQRCFELNSCEADSDL